MKLLATLIVCLFAAAAQSATVNVLATGTFLAVSGDAQLLPFSVPDAGAQFVLSFSYDTAAVDVTGSADPNAGLFINAISAMSLSIGTDSYSAIAPGTILIVNDGVQDGNPDTADLWNASARVYHDPSPGSEIEHDIALSLLNAAPLAESPIPPLTSGFLVEPFLSPAWDIAAIRFRVKDELVPGEVTIVSQAEATLDSLVVTTVPLPPAALLFGSAICLLGAWRGRSQ